MKTEYPNRDDWDGGFWRNNYMVYLSEFGIPFAVNADNEQDALDYVIDHCEIHCPGLIMSHTDEEEEEYLDEYLCGGNHGRYLNTDYIHIEQV